MNLGGKKLLVTGASGMLAGDLIPKLDSHGAEVELADLRAAGPFADRIRQFDLTDPAKVKRLVSDVRPSWIVNCAAFTAVDQAEKDYGLALAVNAVGVANVAQAAKDVHAAVVHFSTDYVFGAAALPAHPHPFAEEAHRAPCGVYGHSKRLGEDLLTAHLPSDHLLIRTSWLHGVNGPNFVDTMLRLGKDQPMLKVVNDQTGSPTWTEWLADITVKLIAKNARGIFHASSRGNITWFDFAREIFRQAGLSVDVRPQTTTELNRPAPRPPYSTLDVSKLERTLGETCISWKEGISAHLRSRGIEVQDHG